MAGKIATRGAYGKAIVALAEKYPKLVVLDADLAKATMTKDFAAAYPDRFFDCGIAENNMVGIAAGMAASGLKPFANTFAIFAAGRSYEQVRNSVAYPHLNVTVVGSHGGISVGEDGATHQCTEDLALMRQIPGMLVLNPCDGNEMTLAVEALMEYEGPAYLRLGRPAVETFTDELEDYKFELGKGILIADGTDVTIVATGMMVGMARKARELLAADGISARVLDIHTIKPLDCELICKAAKETGALVTCEEHNIIGGLGGAVAEVLAQEGCGVPVEMIGMQDTHGESGPYKPLLKKYGLDEEAIAAAAEKAVSRK
jgi:transketolase